MINSWTLSPLLEKGGNSYPLQNKPQSKCEVNQFLLAQMRLWKHFFMYLIWKKKKNQFWCWYFMNFIKIVLIEIAAVEVLWYMCIS